MGVVNKKIAVAKDIPKNIFADSSKTYIDLFVNAGGPKNTMVAMKMNKQKSCHFEKNCLVLFFSYILVE